MGEFKLIMRHTRVLIVLLFVISQTLSSQTSNIGEFSIKENTTVSVLKSLNNKVSSDFINDGELYLHSHLENLGTFTFLSTLSSSMHFVGNTLQEIQGNELIEINKLILKNTSEGGILLDNDISIKTEGDFTDGIMHNRTTDGTITFLKEAGAIHTSNGSFVDGSVEKLGDVEFVYPVGAEEYYRKCKITSPEKVTDIFTSEYEKKSSNTQYLHKLKENVVLFIDTKEYWEIRRDGGNSEVLITLYWDENTTSPEILEGSKTSIHIVRWDAENNLWVDEGGLVNESENSVTTVLKPKKYGIFALAKIKEDLVFLDGCLTVYNAVTNNEDSVNEYLRIKCIEKYPNTLDIFNRWGVKVFSTINYNNDDNAFRGISEGRGTFMKQKKLPSGTYYYILNFEYEGKMYKKVSYLYINNGE